MAEATATMAIVEVTEVIGVTAEETEDAPFALQPLLLLAHVRVDALRSLDRRWAVWAALNPAHVGDDAAHALRPLHDDHAQGKHAAALLLRCSVSV
eukprot:10988332-Alexandrium_andersonii.AAC.1